MSWLDRLKQEKAELEEKFNALGTALEAPHESISKEQTGLLTAQYDAMNVYLGILIQRLDLIESEV
jgi:hypothetical protein